MKEDRARRRPSYTVRHDTMNYAGKRIPRRIALTYLVNFLLIPLDNRRDGYYRLSDPRCLHTAFENINDALKSRALGI